ncbi:hypothetical protein MLD38_034099 [Melastoma candidum]|uniref:Uncharacterized protein n=1 Tax=Melastoma candidum TaxID=119954 RepID=A0ACB9MCQ4_9MYRT|nr:hypothetical protein MLD38_034099 [Melastoma candidum]
MKVTKTCEKLVKPKTPTPPHLRRCGLTLFDLCQKAKLIPCCFFYHFNRDDHEGNIEARLARLEESLSEALVVHYPMAGRYVEEGHFIDCNDQGAEFIVGRVDVWHDEILEKDRDRPGLDFMELIVRTPSFRANLPLVVAQVYIFVCGAVAIGFSIVHRVADCGSAITFLKGWAMLSRCGILGDASYPSFECIAGDVKIGSIGAEGPPSRVKIVFGLLWKAVVKIDGWKSNGNHRAISFQTAMNLRGIAGKLTPKNAFGNLVMDVYVEAGKEDREMELNGFVKAVQRTIKNARSKYASIDNAEEFLAMAEGDSRSIDGLLHSRLHKEKHVVCSTCSCGFGSYEIDFGLGKPELADATRTCI